MEIRTITCHNVYNYGASLQAFALQRYLEMLGHNAMIIDFLPYHLRGRYNFLYVHKKSPYYHICQKYPILKLLYGIKNNKKMFKTYGRKKAFDKFSSEYIKKTEQSYLTSKELKNNPPKCDLLIAGSDQIWNTQYGNGREPAFYLDFGDKSVFRISYAASFGTSGIDTNIKDFIKKELQNIDKISVREKSALDILSSLGISNAIQVTDPVFLLNSNQWSELSSHSKKYNVPSKYILLYDFIGDPKIVNYIEDLKIRRNGECIVSLNDFDRSTCADINVNNAGPLEFLSLILNSDFIVTNSFHATAFSVIFKKEFMTFPLYTQPNSSRMEEFLRMTGLNTRYNPVEGTEIASIDYDKVWGGLETKIQESKDFINDVINYTTQHE